MKAPQGWEAIEAGGEIVGYESNGAPIIEMPACIDCKGVLCTRHAMEHYASEARLAAGFTPRDHFVNPDWSRGGISHSVRCNARNAASYGFKLLAARGAK